MNYGPCTELIAGQVADLWWILPWALSFINVVIPLNQYRWRTTLRGPNGAPCYVVDDLCARQTYFFAMTSRHVNARLDEVTRIPSCCYVMLWVFFWLQSVCPSARSSKTSSPSQKQNRKKVVNSQQPDVVWDLLTVTPENKRQNLRFQFEHMT